MIVERIVDRPNATLAGALAEFEDEFSYPLSPDRSFRISHGQDYPLFFRAMGAGCSFVASDRGRVLGTLGMSICRLILPGGDQRPVAYVGDLKIRRCARGRSVLWQLSRAAKTWAGTQVNAAYGVVMGGTVMGPKEYTGRLGIPEFRALATIRVLSLQTSNCCSGGSGCFLTDRTRGCATYRRLSQGRYSRVGGEPAERSQMAPLWLVAPDGSACGRLEDTRRAKRLLSAENSTEMLSAHLACFAFSRPETGLKVLREARRIAGQRGFPALFVAVAEQDMSAMPFDLGELDGAVASATVYGAGLEAGPGWNINASEI
jgi:hypothetical protein